MRKRVFLGGCGLLACLIVARPLVYPQEYLLAGVLLTTGLMLRAWASGVIRKGTSLATGGPYSLLRHPLYAGSMLVSLGCSLTTGRWWIVVVLNLGFLLLYNGLMGQEEALLRERFGAEADRFLSSRRRWVPAFGNGALRTDWSCRRLLWGHHEWQAWLGIALYLGLLIWRLQYPSFY